MGYITPLKLVNRPIGKHILVSSCPFQILNKLDVGARMFSFNYEGDKIIVYSPLPYGDEVIGAWQELTGLDQTQFNVTHVVVVNLEHNLVAQSYKEVFPNVKIIALEKVRRIDTDIKLAKDDGPILNKDVLVSLGIGEPAFVDNIELAFLRRHKNSEILLYEKNEKLLCVGDTIFNLSTGTWEQYCEALGYSPGYTPLTGWSFSLRFINPLWFLGRLMMRRVTAANTPEGKKDLQVVANRWDFTRIEVLHGNPVTSDAKKVFSSCLNL